MQWLILTPHTVRTRLPDTHMAPQEIIRPDNPVHGNLPDFLQTLDRDGFLDTQITSVAELMDGVFTPEELAGITHAVTLGCSYGFELVGLRRVLGDNAEITGIERHGKFARGSGREDLQMFVDLSGARVILADYYNSDTIITNSGHPDLILARHPFTRWDNFAAGFSNLSPWIDYSAVRRVPMVVSFYEAEKAMAELFFETAEARVGDRARVRFRQKTRPCASWYSSGISLTIRPDYYSVRIN